MHPTEDQGTSNSPQPQKILQYRIDSVVARGGFGTVCRATDTTLDRTVALKLIDDLRRAPALIAEAKNTSRLSHPGIAQVYQAGTDPVTGLAFIAFEWVEGPTLRALLRRGEMPVARCLRIGQDIAAAVAAAHTAGLIHGDLKADNVVITGEPGRAKLLDFGLSVPDEEFGNGELWGTPAYMAPELLAGEPRTVKSDLFALGVLLFELVTCKLPFGGEDGDEHTVRLRQEERAADPRQLRPDLPSDLAEQIRTLIARDPESRAPDAVELERVFRLRRRATEGGRPRAVPILFFFLLLAGAAWIFRDPLGIRPRTGADPGRRGAISLPTVSVGPWTAPGGAETDASRTLRDLLAVLISAEDPGSALLVPARPPFLAGTIEIVGNVSGTGEWTARWESPTGRGQREERALGALPLAKKIAERVAADGAANQISNTVDVPEEALLIFCEAVRLAGGGELEAARERFAYARDRVGAFPEAAAWEASLWVVLDRPAEARTLLSPLGDVTSAPARVLAEVLEIPVTSRGARWGSEHRLARLLDLALARRDPLVPDDELLGAIDEERGIGLPWLARERVAIALRAGDAGTASDALERFRVLAGSPASRDLWRLEHALALSMGVRAEVIDAFQERLFELPGNDPLGTLKIPFLLQKGRLGPAADAAQSAATNADTSTATALILAIAGRFDGAIERTRRIEDPFDPSLASRVRAAILILAGDKDGATRALQEARQVDPGRPETLLLIRFIEGDPFALEGESTAPSTPLGRFVAPLHALGDARALRVGGDPAAGRRSLDGVGFVTDDLEVFPWPEAAYLSWLERIICLEGEGKGDDARKEWRTFRGWWPEGRAPASRVSLVATEVESFLEGGGKSGD